MRATKSKQTASRANSQLEQAKAKASVPKGGLEAKAELDASFVPYLLGKQPEADDPPAVKGGETEDPVRPPPPPGRDTLPKVSADPSAETESVKDATYKKLDGTPFVKGDGDEHEVAPNDVKQGSLGDCYLVAALAAVAKTDPEIIKNMIKDNGDGTYTVSFHLKEGRVGIYSSGSKVSIRVTQELPVRYGSTPAFAKTGDTGNDGPELWVALIEKAWAVHQGSYEQARGSKATMNADIMSFLTGAQTNSITCSGMAESDLLKAMVAGSTGGHPMTASMPTKEAAGEDVVKLAEEKGLYFNHAYTIMTVDKDGK
ncbi:MAG: hypothetical protein FJ125_06370, partial [Deltaproteobacteria bacterium]|nr:hypothetical protein [Deltaproteobacteria bacterium]